MNAANQQCKGAPQAPLEPYAAPKAVVYFVLAAEEQRREAGELIGTAAAASSMGLQWPASLALLVSCCCANSATMALMQSPSSCQPHNQWHVPCGTAMSQRLTDVE